MKKIFIVFLLLLSFENYCQNHKLDSLRLKANSKINDSDKVKAIFYLTQFYLNINHFDSGAYYADRGVETAELSRWDFGIAGAYMVEGTIFENEGNYSKALEIKLKALKIYEKHKERPAGIGAAYFAIGNVYQLEGDNDEAIRCWLKTIKIFQDANFKSSKRIYRDIYCNIATAYIKKENYDSSLYFTNKAYELAVFSKDTLSINNCYLLFGDIYSKKNDIIIANGFYRKCIDAFIKDENVGNLSTVYSGLAENYKTINQVDSSIIYGNLAFAYAIKSESVEQQKSTAIFLIDYYKKIKMYDSLSKYQGLLITYNDTLHNIEKNKKFQELSTNEFFRQKELERLKKQEMIDRRNMLQIFGISIFILILAIMTFIVIKKKIKSKYLSYVGTLTLVLLFAFISFLVSPYITKITQETPVWVLLASIILSFILSFFKNIISRFINSRIMK